MNKRRRWLSFTTAPAILGLVVASIVCAQESRDDPEKLAVLEGKARTFVGQLSDSQFDAATKAFDETMMRVLSPSQLQTIWESITGSIGALEKITSVRHDSGGGYDIVFVTCKFANASLDARVVFDRQGRITGLFFVPSTAPRAYENPAYVDPSSFEDQEVSFGMPPWTLTGTLSRPVGQDVCPVVILVHGSGPNDRDESVGANKPFKDLAGGLASRGISVLRYDKRTKLYPEKFPPAATVKEETIDDVLAAADWLSMQTAIDPQRIFVLGHSLGGCLVPRIAKADTAERIAGYVLVAGNTRPLEDLIAEQTRYVLGLDGQLSESDQASLDEIDRQVQQVKSLATQKNPQPVFGANPAYWLDLDGYQPQIEAKSVTKPLLILQGERDYQVTMKDFANWRAALSDRPNVQFKSYPTLNHLMIAGSGPSKPAEYEIPGHVASEVIEDVTAWVRQQGP